MRRRRRFSSVWFLAAVIVAVWPNSVSATCWLPKCWRAFWSRSSAAQPIERSAASRRASTRDVTASIDSRRGGRLTGCLQEWSSSRRQPDYGLACLPPPAATYSSNQLVVYVHGMNSRPEDLSGLVAEGVAAGHWCATFRYRNDQPIRRSARQLAALLRGLHREQAGLLVCLVAHSMGGLVAREAIEDPRLKVPNVCRLIMIAPPNQGSQLARYACSLDVWEYVTSGARRREAGLIVGSVCDGWAEAADDLRPDSAFLRQLNARPRNPRVEYSIFVGTAGPLAHDQCATPQDWLQAIGRRCGWDAAANGRLCVLPADELLSGKGDGCVAVRRARLSGVRDVVVGHFSHRGILQDAEHPEVRRMRAAILERL
jgi:pimeloyl-ACP methyl ester carboxylesterase